MRAMENLNPCQCFQLDRSLIDEFFWDIEIAMSMAPGAQFLFYQGGSLEKVYNKIISDNLATMVTTSTGNSCDLAGLHKLSREIPCK